MKNGKKALRRISILFAILFLIPKNTTCFVSANTPYKTFTIDGYDNIQMTQSAYLAAHTITKFGSEFLNTPSDICVTEDDEIYVADSGNARILVGDLTGKLKKIIGEGTLVAPKGVFVTKDKHVYVADRDAEAIFEFDESGEMCSRYNKPDNPLYGANTSFLPIKIVVNDAGIMYVICESNTNGIVEISPIDGGTFLGYFGTNFADVNIQTVIYRAIATDAQKAKMVSNIPSTPDNLAIDKKGLIYTVTRGDEYKTLKRLNIAGKNLIDPDAYEEIPAAVTVGNHENIYMVSQQGYIYEFNKDGDLLYVFGGLDDGTQRVGLSTLVSSIQTDSSDKVYVLDSDKSRIQVYEPTEFTDLLHQALKMYSNGRYTESKEPLTQVLKMNSMFDYANEAMGRAYFQEENYEMALHYARIAKDHDGYSDAFWEIRNLWLKKNTVWLLLVFFLLWAGVKTAKLLDRRKNLFNTLRMRWERMKKKTIVSNLLYAKYFMFHPMDGSYGIAREKRASFLAPAILLLVFMAEYIINRYFCGFLQKTVMEGRYEIISDIGLIAVVIFSLTACNYLVCTINEGEGTVKKIFTYFSYSLMPYIVLTPIVFILSHVLTENEAFLILFTQIVMLGWMLVLMVLAIKEVNNYTAGETFKIICLTIFTILILALLLFVLYVLWAQVFEFINAIFGEVVYRLGY